MFAINVYINNEGGYFCKYTFCDFTLFATLKYVTLIKVCITSGTSIARIYDAKKDC